MDYTTPKMGRLTLENETASCCANAVECAWACSGEHYVRIGSVTVCI